eukprot:Amastigsp_a514912_11.p2 type:complete len:106 gc:universal Amastigsp_a514912_11:120-437(+)
MPGKEPVQHQRRNKPEHSSFDFAADVQTRVDYARHSPKNHHERRGDGKPKRNAQNQLDKKLRHVLERVLVRAAQRTGTSEHAHRPLPWKGIRRAERERSPTNGRE